MMTPMRFSLGIATLLATAAATSAAQTDGPLLLQKPTISKTSVAFAYGGDIWTAPRSGGAARRLTAGNGEASDPMYSPDGSLIAFTGTYDGNTDVYVVSADGGVPKRLTYHPAPDGVVGWTPDGARVLFHSPRSSFSRYARLFTVSKDGGPATEVPLPRGFAGSYSSDGSRLAYMPNDPANEIWKRYRGGETSEIWLVNLADASIEKIPRENSNDSHPMWIGNSVYFLSDRDGPTTLFEYDTHTKQVTRMVTNAGFDIKSASANGDAIVYEQFGALYLFDTGTKRSTPIQITVAGDLPNVRPHYVAAAPTISAANLSPTGARAVFQARGEILTVPAEKGDVRNLTNTTGVMERDPAWSPDGRWIAFFSDASGEYTLHIVPQEGQGAPRVITLGDPPSFYYSPEWSPDSKKISYIDKRLHLWYLDVATGKSTKIDTDPYEAPWRSLDPVWSPDSRWVAYTRSLENHFHAVFLYSLETGTATQVTDGMSDARFPAFDRSGDYLYFTGSTNAGASVGWLDMSSYDHPVTRSLYITVLRNDKPSPLTPESDDEKADTTKPAAAADTAKKKAAPAAAMAETPIRIDLQNINQRILALPLGERRWSGIFGGAAGTIYILETVDKPPQSAEDDGGTRQTLYKWDLTSRKLVKLVDGIMGFGPQGDVDERQPSTFRLSAKGTKMLYRADGQWVIAGVDGPPKPGEGVLNVNDIQIAVDPRAEWKQMYHEAFRVERDFFYDPHYHGLDLKAEEAKYEPYVTNLASQEDLRYLLTETMGELTVGHLFIYGGEDPPLTHPPRTGLLGADYSVDHGRYRFERIYSGENWNPALKAPLTQPGVNISVGEYLIGVNGVDVKASEDIYEYFAATAGKTTVLRVSRDPSGAGARDVNVVPVASETPLRNLDWIEGNRQIVGKLSGGKLGYVYLPNTAGAGYNNFNRYYFAQTDKQGIVLDERFNGGGSLADYMIQVMHRVPLFREMTRDATDFTTPVAAIYGPKVMITNEYAGSGGDALPFMFQYTKTGPLVGKRTWGGLVGIYDYPVLMDGMTVTAPRVAIYTTRGQFEIENHGVAPDVTVELDPAQWRAGHDTQLERAVAIALDSLAQHPPIVYKRPPYPNYHPVAGSTASAGGSTSTKP
jgi:tricorn protease